MNLTNKKILVTGSEGFIGSHLVEALVTGGCDVTALVLYNSFNSWGWLDTLPREIIKKIRIFPGDIRDPNGIRTAIKGHQVVFHLAALIAIPFSYHSPDSYIDTNIRGTLNILQGSRDSSLERVLITSTSEVYGTAQYVPIDERHPFQGQSPYSASKIGADRIAESFWRSFDLPVTIVRPFNTFGPRQSARAFIPTVITQILAGQKKIRLGSLTPTRDLNYVKDVVSGFMEIARSDGTIGEEINIATQQEVGMEKVACEIMTLLNAEVKFETDPERIRPERSEVFRLCGSNEKIRRLTGWVPRYTLADGLAETIDWFRKNSHRYKSDIYNL